MGCVYGGPRLCVCACACACVGHGFASRLWLVMACYGSDAMGQSLSTGGFTLLQKCSPFLYTETVSNLLQRCKFIVSWIGTIAVFFGV